MSFKQQLLAALPFCDGSITVECFGSDHLQERYVGWLNDAEVVRFSNQRFVTHTLASCAQFYSSIKLSSGVFLAVSHNELGYIGTMTVYFSPHHGTADIGILIGDKRCWGKGVGLSAWRLVLETVGALPGLRKVTAGTLACNIGMLSVMERSGMEPDGIRAGQELVNGTPVDIHYYAKFFHH
ncbi:GNAT family N-acetyltransferase [Thalassolituus sp. LLYu03]|uniref:GNAT family N-acetyltransferase n=1 Tax=Thalassolituus sp. LLYu03 TaxID=3421656 RepID=UPI003D269A40